MPPGLGPERRAKLISALNERGRLLRLPDELISKALVRCLPRSDGQVTTPSSLTPTGVGSGPGIRAVDSGTSAPTPVPTLVATAPTEPGDDGAVAPVTIPPAIKPASVAASAAPGAVGGHDALTPLSLARLGGESGQWDALEAGAIIAGYRIESPLGAGAMGQVYRATQLSMNRAVAFKVLSPKLSSNPKFRERFVREARAAGRLHHPNLISVHDVGEADGLMFFSMELVDGTTVAELLRRHGRIPETRALEICRQTLEALKFAHANGIIHRDIKPDNLMVTHSGMVKVADLGLARAEDINDASVTATNVGAVMGTPHYMAPEQGRDAHRVDHRADLYAVGATLYHLVCGHTPFGGDSAMEVLMRSASQPLKFPEPGPSPAVRVLISRLMEKEASDRPQSAAEAIEMVSKLRRKQVDEDPESAPTAAEAVQRARRRRLRRTMRKISWYAFGLSIALVVMVVVMGLAGGWQWSSAQAEVSRLAKSERYREAIQVLDRQQPGVMSPAKEINRIRSDVEKAWDSWAYLKLQGTFSSIGNLIADRKLPEAYTALQGISEDLMSPGVRKDFEAYQRKWEEAMLAEDAALPKPPDGRVRELWPQEYVNHLGGDLLHRFTFTPVANAVVRENTVRFTGTGNGRGDVSSTLNVRSLRFTVKFPDSDHGLDQVSLPFADGHLLVLKRSGMVLRGAGAEDRVLLKESDQYSFSLLLTNEAVELLPQGSLRPLPIAKATKELVWSWDIGANRAIDIRLRVVPFERRSKKN
jgi:tRNA A-37 threonylcarbamoyl transferase component Bud32